MVLSSGCLKRAEVFDNAFLLLFWFAIKSVASASCNRLFSVALEKKRLESWTLNVQPAFFFFCRFVTQPI